MPQTTRRFQRRPPRIARHRNPHHAQSKLLSNSPLSKRDQLRNISIPRLSLKLRREQLQTPHALLKPPMQRRPNHPLQRLKQKNQHEQQNASCSLRRQHRLKPPAHPPNKCQVQQRQKCRRKRIHQIPLRPVIKKIVLQGKIDQECPGKNRADSDCSSEFVVPRQS